ncbi:putative glycosyltransferase EpsF [Paenibacillus montaniterrae]|uniref:Glycosyltransferase EpsF n=1 Tax=Paenibacillus montaniterrae TaxID=429341 RepID=A0A919YTC4_9BACL|nr:glycosyltransferase family 1 protein [Paenibacillus montaniterrae]GIP16503.1 putative glycosyltransferase EpsF [Paenibacillus montaniterrae]
MRSPIRILHVFAHMNRGGAETMIMNIYRKINRDEIQFDFIVHSTEKGAYDDEISLLGGTIYCLPKYRGVNHLEYIKSWQRFFEVNKQYKIIHGHMRSTASLYLSIAKRYGLVTIAHSHSTSSRGSYIEKKIKGVLQYPIRFIADYFFSCSNAAGTWLFGKKIVNQSNYKIIYNGVDTSKFQFSEEKRIISRKCLNLNEDNIVLGHIGSFTEPKNHSFLIDILKECKKVNDNVVLVLVGDGPLNTEIRNKITFENLESSVLLLGIRDDIDNLIHGFDKFVFPSLYEGLPVTLIEAQANGLKCYISDRITKEVVITDLIESLSLNDSPNIWAMKILESSKVNNRKLYAKDIIESGYDITNVAGQLSSFYFRVINKIDCR